MSDTFDVEGIQIGAAIYESHLMRQENVQQLKALYRDWPDRIIITEVVKCGSRINNIVPNNGFPAYDIALNMYDYRKTPTTRQRQALINVLAHYSARG